jgi:hypothetical protein
VSARREVGESRGGVDSVDGLRSPTEDGKNSMVEVLAKNFGARTSTSLS